MLWGGSAASGLHAVSRGRAPHVREELIRGTRVQCALDFHERPMHCHHEKLVIVDGRAATWCPSRISKSLSMMLPTASEPASAVVQFDVRPVVQR